MKRLKMNLANIEGKLSRSEMKKIMDGRHTRLVQGAIRFMLYYVIKRTSGCSSGKLILFM